MSNCELCGDCSCDTKHRGKHEPKDIRVRFCPECKSTDVKFVFHLQNLFGLVPRMECLKCKNHAADFPILVVPAKKLQEMKKKAAKKKTVNKVNKKITKKVKKQTGGNKK